MSRRHPAPLCRRRHRRRCDDVRQSQQRKSPRHVCLGGHARPQPPSSVCNLVSQLLIGCRCQLQPIGSRLHLPVIASLLFSIFPPALRLRSNTVDCSFFCFALLAASTSRCASEHELAALLGLLQQRTQQCSRSVWSDFLPIASGCTILPLVLALFVLPHTIKVRPRNHEVHARTHYATAHYATALFNAALASATVDE